MLNKPTQFVTLTGMGMIKSDSIKNRIVRMAYRNAFSQAAGIVYENETDRSFSEALKLASPKKGHVMVSSGVDFDLYPDCPHASNHPVKILFASRLVWSKGLQELFDASELLQSARSGKVVVNIVGEFEDGHPRSVSRAKIEEYEQKNTVNYLGAFAADEMPQIIRQHDVIVLPSYSEGFSKFLMEGAAAGKPLIATDISGCKEICVNELTGLLVPMKNAQALFNAMLALVDSEALRKRYGENARVRALNNYNQVTLAERMMEIYQQAGRTGRIHS